MTAAHYAFEYTAGLLSEADEQQFLDHLATCLRCQADLDDAVQLAALEAGARREPGDELAERRRRRRLGVTLLGIAGVAAAAGLLWSVRPTPRETMQIALATERTIEVRLTSPLADRYRPYGVQRGATGHEAISPEAIAALSHGGARRDVAAAYMLAGERTRARVELDALPASPDRDSDLSALALLDGNAEEAIRLADHALIAQPTHRQARWNRALALIKLDLIGAAAAELEQVYDTDPAWTREAAERAGALRSRAGDRAKAWYAIRDAGAAMLRGGAPLSLEAVRRFPGSARLYVYDALRVAREPARLDALAPLVTEIDRRYGRDDMTRALAAARARREDAARAALVDEYVKLIARDSKLDEAGWNAWLANAQRSGASDLVLGALVRRDAVAAHLDEYRALAAATRDPWFELLAIEQSGEAHSRAGKLRDAEVAWLEGRERCAKQPLPYRCATIEKKLATLYKLQHRLAEARGAARAALATALVDNEWYLALGTLTQLGDIELFGDRYAMARAFLDEAERGAGGDCAAIASVHRLRAQVAMAERRYPTAHAELAELPACKTDPVDVNRVALVVDLARHGAPVVADAEAALLIDQLRGKATSPTAAFVADVLGARLTIDRDPAARVSLEAALTRAKSLDGATARTFETWALLTLTIDDARNGRWHAMFDDAARPTGAPAPARCAVAAAVDDARIVVAVRSANGELRGAYKLQSGPFDAAAIVPDALRASLAGCDQIVVLALPPLIGEPRLLPRMLPWAFRVSAGAPQATAATPRRVVVADVTPPTNLGLPALGAWRGAPADVVLRGPEAHPARVLAELADATEIEIHAHGVVDLSVSPAPVIALSPGADGGWALTSEALRGERLRGTPTVILGECRVAALTPYEAWGLPTAFIAAGARSVLAAADAIDDREAAAFFDEVRATIRTGLSPAAAVAEVATRWLARDPNSWVASVMVFE